MTSLGRQFLLLMWKNWVLQKRKVCVTVFEIILPIFFAALLVLVRLLANRDPVDNPTYWKSFKPNSVEFFAIESEVYNISAKYEILYTPKAPVIDQVMNNIFLYLPKPYTSTDFINGSVVRTTYNWTLKSFDTEEELLKYHELYYRNIWAGVVFDATRDYNAGLPKDVLYSLRVSRQQVSDRWSTKNTYPFFQLPGFRNNISTGGNPNYFRTGFLGLQYAMDVAITEYFNQTSNIGSYDLYLQKMPYPPFVRDPLISVIQSWLPTFVMLSFILTSLQTAKAIVYEKENKLKESMKLMGLNSFIYWLTWLLKALIYLLLSCAVYTILFSIPVSDKGKVLAKSDPSLVYVFFICYSVSIISYCFMVSTFFNKANSAAFASGIFYFLSYVPYFFLQSRYETMSKSEKLGASLLNNMAMAFGINTIGLYEGAGDGVQWDNFMHPATVDDNFSLLEAMLMLLGDSAIYLLVTWYVDGVFPGEYGVPLPWYFPFTKNYWCGTTQAFSSVPMQKNNLDPRYFERDPTGLSVGISIQHLRKEFGSGKKKKVAVADTSLNLFQGQITALLGHNGAGKTTTMSMLTGFIPPTSGTATVNGYDICDDIRSVRTSLGLCPQHNILFDTMTVEEHLIFFARLKGCQGDLVMPEVNDMIRVLGLEAKRNKFSMTLSGGQKRKLSVGIALIADSKIVILDEPTSGMDPAARRQTWEILQKFREGRTLVLSTHFMDEADLLGDRIAIMSNGVVKCCGTSLFLKKIYGAGYHLVMVKDKGCDVSRVTDVIRRHIPSAELESDISAELSYLLPFDESSQFENLFLDIEKQKAELKLTSFGTSATTMEEVFLKVGEDMQSTEEMDEMPKTKPEGSYINPSYGSTENMSNGVAGNGVTKEVSNGKIPNGDANGRTFIAFNSELTKNTGITWTLQQFWGMFIKKVIHTWRNRTVTLVQLLVPVIFTILALTVEKTIPKVEDEPSLELNLNPFDSSTTIYGNGPTSSALGKSLSDDYAKSFTSKGYGVEEYTGPGSFEFAKHLLSRHQSIGPSTFKRQFIVAGQFDNVTLTKGSVTSYFNSEPLHANAISLGSMMNGLLQHFTDDSHSIRTINNPFPRPVDDNSRGIGYATRGTGFTIAFCIIFGMAFLSTSFIIFLIRERSSGAKHLQKVSGVSSYAYWFSNLVWDICNYLIPVFLIMICFAAFQTKAYTLDNRLGLIFLMFLLYGWACMPFVYLLHYLFKTPAAGMVVVSLLNILTGLATTMAVFVLEIPDLDVPEEVGDALDWVFTIFLPNFCLSQALMNVYVNYEYEDICEGLNYKTICALPTPPVTSCCRGKCESNCLFFEEDYLSWETPGSGKYFVFMAAQGLFYLFLVFLVEFGLLSRIRYVFVSIIGGTSVGSDFESQISGIVQDSDVEAENRRINGTSIDKLLNTESLVLKNLSKTYGSYSAVKGISIGVPEQECFGLLGQNGAGKTSTFKMLTGDEDVTGGNAYLNGYDVKTDLKMVQQNLGYCPQFDALIDQMTGRETLTMYARLRGVGESEIKGVVNELLDIMMLRKYADRQCGTYSGGNKRKLSTAIALVGDPSFILLDEPTTGMDPAARRQLWNVLSQVRASGRTLILTSHSMEECDALCTKIVIMVNGKFVCLGSSQHLKNKFGQGYTLIVRLAVQKDGTSAPAAPLKEFIISRFPDSVVFDDHQGYVHFQIPDMNIPLANVFGEMERAKSNFNIEDYSVHQTTLEQVFLYFTRHQEPPKEESKRRGCCCCFS